MVRVELLAHSRPVVHTRVQVGILVLGDRTRHIPRVRIVAGLPDTLLVHVPLRLLERSGLPLHLKRPERDVRIRRILQQVVLNADVIGPLELGGGVDHAIRPELVQMDERASVDAFIVVLERRSELPNGRFEAKVFRTPAALTEDFLLSSRLKVRVHRLVALIEAFDASARLLVLERSKCLVEIILRLIASVPGIRLELVAPCFENRLVLLLAVGVADLSVLRGVWQRVVPALRSACLRLEKLVFLPVDA